MKRLLLTIFCLIGTFFFTTASAALPSEPDSIIIPQFLNEVKLSQVIHLSAKDFYDFCTINGRKPGFKEKIAFPLTKLKMKKAVAKDTSITVGQFLSTRTNGNRGGDFLLTMVLLLVIVIVGTLLAGGPSFGR